MFSRLKSGFAFDRPFIIAQAVTPANPLFSPSVLESGRPTIMSPLMSFATEVRRYHTHESSRVLQIRLPPAEMNSTLAYAPRGERGQCYRFLVQQGRVSSASQKGAPLALSCFDSNNRDGWGRLLLLKMTSILIKSIPRLSPPGSDSCYLNPNAGIFRLRFWF